MRDTREAAMRRHPAGKGRIGQLIAEAQDRQAMEMANRGRAELELWVGGPMSPPPPRPGPRPVWVIVAGQVAGIVGLFLLLMVAMVAAEVAGGWPR